MNVTVILWILIGFLIFNIAFYFFSTYIAAYLIYTKTLKRKSKDQWGRAVSAHIPLHVKMYEEGLAWQEKHDEKKQDVHIVNNGLNLYGEYYNLGYKKAVMILSGRTESLKYGYYFAKPYSESGFNVLVIDPRAHGYSDGEYNTVGFEESKDAVAWANFLGEKHGIETIVFHGICIGAAAGMLAITSPNCPKNVKGLVTEGMFANFAESMKNHLIERKKMLPPVMQFIDLWMKKYTGHSMMKGPINFIGKMDKPLLMIQSKKDKYSLPSFAQRMYERCPSKEKHLVLFEEGDHSMLRITDTEKYDKEIKTFLEEKFNAIEP